MDSTSEDDNQAHAKGRRLALALLFSLAFHTLLLSLTFGDAEFGLPGLNVFWREQPVVAPSLRVELASPVVEAPLVPLPVAVVEQRKVGRFVTKPIAMPPVESKAVVMVSAPRPEPMPDAVPVLPERSKEVERPPAPPPAVTSESAPVRPVAPEPVATVPPIELPKQEPKPDQATTAQLEMAQQEVARQEAARAEAERREAGRNEVERRDAARKEAERLAVERELQRQEAVRREAERQEVERQEVARREAEQEESERIQVARAEAERKVAERLAAASEIQRQEAAKREAARIEAERLVAEHRAAELEAQRQEAVRREAVRIEAERREFQRQEALRLEAARAAAREEEERREARLRAIGRQLDEEAAQREAAAKLPRSLSTARRIRLLARTDPNEELVQFAETMARKIQLNTPADTVRDLARRRHTDPLVTVAIRSDGSVESVTIVVSSGVAEIDAAIRSIVQSHAPYQAFPPGLARQVDVVEIRRTWYFDVAVRLN